MPESFTQAELKLIRKYLDKTATTFLVENWHLTRTPQEIMDLHRIVHKIDLLLKEESEHA